MNDLREISDSLWLCARPLLETFASRVVREEGSTFNVGRTQSEMFSLRGHVGFRKSPDGDEVAVIIDAIIAGGVIEIVAGAYMDNGQEIGEGPTASICFAQPQTSESSIAAWLVEFERFLGRIEPAIRAQVRALPA